MGYRHFLLPFIIIPLIAGCEFFDNFIGSGGIEEPHLSADEATPPTESILDDLSTGLSKEDVYRHVDVTKATCNDLKEFRKDVDEAYQSNLQKADKALEEAKEYFAWQLNACVSDIRKDCEQEWNEVQEAYRQSVADLSNANAYKNYQDKKANWEQCSASKKAIEKENADPEKKEECQKIHDTAVQNAQKIIDEERQKLKQKFEGDHEYLNALERKCVSKISSSLDSKPGSKKTLKVILYQGKYLPVSSLHTFRGESKEECNAQEHWHANEGAVKATDGSPVVDPGGCGFGKTASVPVMDMVVQ